MIFSPACRHDNHFSNLHIFFFSSSREFRKKLSANNDYGEYNEFQILMNQCSPIMSPLNLKLRYNLAQIWLERRCEKKKSNNTLSTRECLSTLASSYFQIQYSWCVFRFAASFFLAFFDFFRRLIFQIIYFGGEPQKESLIFD